MKDGTPHSLLRIGRNKYSDSVKIYIILNSNLLQFIEKCLKFIFLPYGKQKAPQQ